AYLDKPYLDALLQTGFNRFSFGIQDFDNDVLKMVNREPSAMPVAELMEYVKGAGGSMDFGSMAKKDLNPGERIPEEERGNAPGKGTIPENLGSNAAGGKAISREEQGNAAGEGAIPRNWQDDAAGGKAIPREQQGNAAGEGAISREEQGNVAGGKVTVNLDFIYGLPGQTVESFTRTLKQAAELRPDRLVTFSYAHVPWLKKHQQILEKRGLPGPQEKTDMFLAGYNVMKAAGYEPIGLDHFVQKEDELYRALENKQLHRNFQGYCTRGTTGQVYAFGVTAISQLEKAYLQNTKSIKDYISEIDNNRFPVEKGMRVGDDQLIIREVITRLMCNKQLNWADLAAAVGGTGIAGTEEATGLGEGVRAITAGQLKKLVGY
ncbi:MAG: hypothetical protein LC655_08485, partial [Bacteroidales bacterium]|nr:hypothetical protein [Bacteroidales bacterium]